MNPLLMNASGTAPRRRATAPFGAAVAAAAAAGRLVVQPRMGFPDVPRMLAGLRAVHDAHATTVGTITLDSYTRVGDHASARKALDEGSDLNGFPIVAHGAETTRRMISAAGAGAGFATQVRHGSPLPQGIVRALLDAGLDATEGGPVSYCLPYSRTPLVQAVGAWADSCRLLADQVEGAHLESFGGCMLGQLCPPGLLVAISVLEGVFFRQHGLRSVSLSYTQGTSFTQDLEALGALRRLADEFLGDLQWHIVLYTYMGVFPRTPAGVLSLLRDSAVLAAVTGTERLIVKTAAEAHRIPTVADNIQALHEAARAAESAPRPPVRPPGSDGAVGVGLGDSAVYAEARALVEAVLSLDSDVGKALFRSFAKGYLDVPYCLHADNAQRSRSWIAPDGTLQWLSVGSMPLPAASGSGARRLSPDDFLKMLTYVQRRYDEAAAAELPAGPLRTPLPTALHKD